jgi:hypothetical protein
VEILLAPAHATVLIHAVEEYGTVPVQSPLPADLAVPQTDQALPAGTSTPVPVAYGGSVTITLPAPYTVTGVPAAYLALAPTAELARAWFETGATRSYANPSGIPADQLDITDLGGNTFRVDMPADDGTNGPFAKLAFTNLGSSNGAFASVPYFLFELSAGGPAAVTLSTQVFAAASDLCRGCEAGVVSAGSAFDLQAPPTALLDVLGVPDLSHSAFSLQALDVDYVPTGDHAPLAATLSADARTATLAVPAGTTPGTYRLVAVAGNGSGSVISQTSLQIVVAAANAGLRSNTGWGEHGGTTDDGLSPLVPVGAGMVLVAGLGAALVLRRRTSPRM